MTAWVGQAAKNGAELLLFPEYGAMELASLDQVDPNDLMAATRSVKALMPRANGFLMQLAHDHKVHIVAPSGVADADAGAVNRAAFLWPDGRVSHQDKQIMTPWETSPWGISGNGPLRVFDTCLGRLGILICYDCEFPLLARQLIEAKVDLILIPSATETMAGYHRVRIGAMARALEGQCFTAMASITGPFPIEAVDISHGAGGVFCPPDVGLPDDGIVALGTLDEPGWVYADLDLGALAKVRQMGGVRNSRDWPLQLRSALSQE